MNEDMRVIIAHVVRAALIIRWPADAWGRLEPFKERLMREWCVAAAITPQRPNLRVELMAELGVLSGLESPAQIDGGFTHFLVAQDPPPAVAGDSLAEDLQVRSLWFYKEGKKRISFNN